MIKRGFDEKKIDKTLVSSRKSSTFATAFKKCTVFFDSLNSKKHTASAVIAQLVEHDLAKVGVASSSLVYRSKLMQELLLHRAEPAQVAEW